MSRHFKFIIALIVWVGFSAAAGAAGDPEAGKAKAATCAACHGADGNSTNPEWPKLAGQGARYLVLQTLAIKTGQGRKNDLMAPMVSSLGEKDIQDIAAFLAAQTPSRGTAEGDLVAQGARLYRGGNAKKRVPACMACHGPAGGGIAAAGFPRLAGQHAPYTITQLYAFRSGARSTDPNRVMRSIAEKLSDDEISAVAQYIAGLYQTDK